VSIDGFSARIESDVPAGAGLSSSAALEIATAFFLLKLARREMAPMEIAKVCQRAEHSFVGVQSGLLDQVCSIFGQEDRVVYFDARTEEVRTFPFPGDLALIITESGSERELKSGFYRQRRAEPRAAADALGFQPCGTLPSPCFPHCRRCSNVAPRTSSVKMNGSRAPSICSRAVMGLVSELS